jgi:hypothetical protein
LKAHISEERYHRSEGAEIIPLHEKSGTRIYVMARPYILEPDYTLTVGMYPRPAERNAIGEVLATEWRGMRQREVGQAQAWFYPSARTLVLWECFLEAWCRHEDPRTDETLHALWTGFEGFLLQHAPGVERIVTPSWEPLYDQDKQAWPHFLRSVGYQLIGPRAFGKTTSLDSNTRPQQ